MNRDDKKCSNCGEVKSIDAYANKWKVGRAPNKTWKPNRSEKAYCKKCCRIFGIRTSSVFSIQEQKIIIEASRIEMLQVQKELYWIHLEGIHANPETEGYVGIGVPGSRPEGSMRDLAEQFDIPESDLTVSILATDIGKEIVKQEFDLRPYDGIGWNYQKGGSVGNGLGSPGVAAEYIRNFNNN